MKLINKAANFIWSKSSFVSETFSEKEIKELIIIILVFTLIFAVPLILVSLSGRGVATPYKVEIINLDQLKTYK